MSSDIGVHQQVRGHHHAYSIIAAPDVDNRPLTLLRAIVGIEISIDLIEGKLKASQDEDMQDRVGTVTGLQKVPYDEAKSMADLVMKAIHADSSG